MPCFYLTPKQDNFNQELQICIAEALYDVDSIVILIWLEIKHSERSCVKRYSPEPNPAEHVWAQVKHHSIGKRFISGPDQLRHLVHSVLRSIQKMPTLVRSFFRAPSTRYAALAQ